MCLTTGTGRALLAGAICAYPFLQRASALEPSAHAAQALPTAIEASKATAAVAMAQTPPAPTIVWHGVANVDASSSGSFAWQVLYRAWSDGRVEMKRIRLGPRSWNGYESCSSFADSSPCSSGWLVISDASNGYSFRSDINFDNQVDG
ncbi:MAG: hypothetical protein FJ260_11550, partial [Planctomycetes bacterium]|nr:hypothetical protein [Planctomycetota bacterium]